MREIGYGVINSIAVKGEDQATELGAGLLGQDTLLHGVPECTPGITAYPELTDKPKINSIELVGDKSMSELGIEPKRGPEDNYISTAEKAALHTHANKGILDYITGPLVAAWNSAVSWVNEVGAAHVVNYLNPHKTSFANIEGYPATPSGKYLKDDGTFAAMPSGGGGSGAPLYLSNANSDIPGYKKLSYTPDAVEVIKTITANNSTVYGETYILDLPIDLSVINAGQWVFDYWRSVSSAAQESYARIESFLRRSDGTETTTYSVESPSIEDTTLTQRIITYTLQQFTVLPTDRFGIRMSFRTTRGANTAYSYIVGGVRGHSIISPVPPRHDYLRDKNGNPDFQHLTNSEKTQGALATGVADYPTVKDIADEMPTAIALALLSEPSPGAGVSIDQVKSEVSNSIDTYSATVNKVKGLKLCTIGDSVTASNLWQPWLKKWGQLVYDDSETLTGVGGNYPMAVGGTTIRPFTNSGGVSIYTRGKDVVNYAPDIITILVTGNDGLAKEGTINDVPYTGGENPADIGITCYSAYMGLVEYILTNLKTARILLLSNMTPRIDFNNDYNYANVVAYNSANRKPWANMAKNIAEKYRLSYINLYDESGVNELNCQPYYQDPVNIGSTAGLVYQIHPNTFGYKTMAQSIINKF